MPYKNPYLWLRWQLQHNISCAGQMQCMPPLRGSSPLGTWDKELLERAAAVVPTFTPADWLRKNPGGRA
jgi:hypothetical protein